MPTVKMTAVFNPTWPAADALHPLAKIVTALSLASYPAKGVLAVCKHALL